MFFFFNLGVLFKKRFSGFFYAVIISKVYHVKSALMIKISSFHAAIYLNYMADAVKLTI